MKRLGSIICLIALLVTMTAGSCFAAQTLTIEDTYPTDGQKNTTKENLCVKLTFSEGVGAKDIREANRKCFKITDPDGKEIPIKVFFDPDDSKKVMVLADTTKELDIKDNTEYTLTVDPAFQDSNGDTLTDGADISFTTMDQGKSTTVYMIMMVIMFGAMFAFSTIQAKKHAAKAIEEKAKEMPFNPYKEAKRTGKPVTQIIAEHEKAMEKKKAKEAKRAAREKVEDDEDIEEEPDNGNYKVKRPRPIADGGSSYITGRKAEAEARKAEEERLAKRRAANKKKKK